MLASNAQVCQLCAAVPQIERIDDDTFRCYVGGLNFLNFRVEPVLTVSVIVGERGPTVKLLETQVLFCDPVVEGARARPKTSLKLVGRRPSVCTQH